jgi:hypothetical protein
LGVSKTEPPAAEVSFEDAMFLLGIEMYSNGEGELI